MESTTRQESDRILGKLKLAIRLLGHTNREIERRLGYTPSYLTRLFSSQIELRFEHIVDIARALGLTADEFFAFAYPPRSDQPSEAAQQLNALLDELRPPSPPPPPASSYPQINERALGILLSHQLQQIVAANLRPKDAQESGKEPGKKKGGTSGSRKP